MCIRDRLGEGGRDPHALLVFDALIALLEHFLDDDGKVALFLLASRPVSYTHLAVCVFGSVLAINGTIEFGVIVSFILYVRLFTTPLTQIAQGMTCLLYTSHRKK